MRGLLNRKVLGVAAGVLAVALVVGLVLWSNDESAPTSTANDAPTPASTRGDDPATSGPVRPTGPTGSSADPGRPSSPPSPTPGPSSPSAPGSTPTDELIPEAFLGTWTGDGHGPQAGRFVLMVTIPHARPLGELAATADLTSLPCRQRWELRDAAPTRLVMRSTLARGACTAEPLRVVVTLTDGRLAVEWTHERTGALVYQAILR